MLQSRQVAELAIGRGAFHARLDVNGAGLLAIGVLVSAILLSTAVLVGVAERNAPRGPAR